MSTNSFISKSQYIKGLQCLKYLYLYRNHPELKDEVPDDRAAMFQSGTDIGILAQSLFPNGITIPFEDVPFKEQVKMTQKAMVGKRSSIYEATFLNDGLFARVDILVRDRSKWSLYEVKGSTAMKDVHLDDVAFQYYVLNRIGIPIKSASIVHINNKYERRGELEIDKLFTIEDVTPEVKKMQTDVKKNIAVQRKTLSGDTPVIDIGPHCSDPYDCDFLGHCWDHIPEVSVFDIRGRGVKPYSYYERGIIEFKDIPISELPVHAQAQVKAFLEKAETIDKKSVKEFLKTICYPLAFLDFETFMSAVPPFDYTKPYEQIPFQYSLHVQGKKKAAIKHFEYLAEPNIDPRRHLIERLITEIPKGACVMAYNMSFERGVLSKLMALYPEHKVDISSIIDNMIDLMEPFKNKAYYSWQMMGSYSLKAVLPVLVPDLSYKGLQVCNGGMAMDAYARMCSTSDKQVLAEIRKGLLEYCHLDTLAMVHILDRLQEVVGK